MQDIIFFGPQGSGKGTQVRFLRRKLRAKVIATGEIARRLAEQQTPHGRAARQFIDEGEMLPDELILPAVLEQIKTVNRRPHLLFDGFPRTVRQARELDHIYRELERPLPEACFLTITQAEAIRRLKKRLMCPVCHRTFNPRFVAYRLGRCSSDGAELIRRIDDDPEIVRHRLRLFHRSVRGLKQYYRLRGRLRIVQGQGTIEAVRQKVFQMYEGLKQHEGYQKER